MRLAGAGFGTGGAVALACVVACGGGGPASTDAGQDGALMDARNGFDARSVDGAADATSSPDGASDTRAADATRSDAGASDGGSVGPTCEADEDLGTATGVDLVVGTTSGEDDDLTPECFPTSRAPDVVFSWEAPSAGLWTLDTLGSELNTVLHVRDEDCGLLACDDDITTGAAGSNTGRTASRVVVEAAAGDRFFIVVDGTSRAVGSFLLSITPFVDEERICDDGLDNDRDGTVDCKDGPTCRLLDPERCIETACEDGLDNDGDSGVDCNDLDCGIVEPCIELTCDDGLDNDGDGLIDCEDESQCGFREPCVETTCADGLDNDADGTQDCGDSDCACDVACTPDPCPDQDLGSALGSPVATGSTVGRCDRRLPSVSGACHFTAFSEQRAPDITFRWAAPRSGTFAFDTLGSDFNTALYLREGSCDGPEIVCNDNATVSGSASALAATLTAGQVVVIVVDGGSEGRTSASSEGAYVLNIIER